MILFTIFVFFKVPETKGKTFEQIANEFHPGGTIEVEFYAEEDEGDVFGDDATDTMLDQVNQRNGSVHSMDADDVNVKIPDEKKSLTKSAERIDNLEV